MLRMGSWQELIWPVTPMLDFSEIGISLQTMTRKQRVDTAGGHIGPAAWSRPDVQSRCPGNNNNVYNNIYIVNKKCINICMYCFCCYLFFCSFGILVPRPEFALNFCFLRSNFHKFSTCSKYVDFLVVGSCVHGFSLMFIDFR